MTPSATIAAIAPTAAAPKPGEPSRASSRSGTAPSPADVAESADRHDLQHEIAGTRHDERDRGADRDRAARVAELARDVRADLPPGEGPDEEADRGADAGPPVGQERREVLRLDGGGRERDDPDDDGEQQRGEDELHPPGDPDAEGVRGERRDEDRERDDGDHRPVDSRDGDDVLAAEDGDDGRAGAHAEHEPVPRHARGGAAERAPHVAGDTARVGVARREHGERAGERHRQHDDRDHRDDARGTRHLGRESGQHEEAGAEHGRDVQRGALHDADAAAAVRRRGASGEVTGPVCAVVRRQSAARQSDVVRRIPANRSTPASRATVRRLDARPLERRGRGIRRRLAILRDQAEARATVEQVVDRQRALDRDAPLQLLRGDSARGRRSVRAARAAKGASAP